MRAHHERRGRRTLRSERVPARVGQPDGHRVRPGLLRNGDVDTDVARLLRLERGERLRSGRARQQLALVIAELPDEADRTWAARSPRAGADVRDGHANA